MCFLLARFEVTAQWVCSGLRRQGTPGTRVSSLAAMARGRLFVDLSPLRQSRAFRRLWGGYLVSTLGSQLTVVAVPYQVFRLTHSSLDVGLVGLAQILPVLAGSLFGGSIADAVDRRVLLLITQLSLAACSLGLALELDGWSGGALAPVRLERPRGGPGECRQSHPFRRARELGGPAAIRERQCPLAAPLPGGPGRPVPRSRTAPRPGRNRLGLLDRHGHLHRLSLGRASLPRSGPPGGGTRFGLRSIAEGLGYLKGKPVLQGTFVVDLNAMILGMPGRCSQRSPSCASTGARRRSGFSIRPPASGHCSAPFSPVGWSRSKSKDAESSSWSRSGGRPLPPSGSFPSCSPLWCCSRSRVRPTSSRQCSGARSCNSRHPKPCGDDSRRCTPRLSPVDPDSVTSRQARWHLCRPRQISVVSGGLGCLLGVGLVSLLMPRFAHYDTSRGEGHGPSSPGVQG